jgi:hypothetical protein
MIRTHIIFGTINITTMLIDYLKKEINYKICKLFKLYRKIQLK